MECHTSRGSRLPRELELGTSTVSDAGASGFAHRAAGCVPVGRTVRDRWPIAGAQLGGDHWVPDPAAAPYDWMADGA